MDTLSHGLWSGLAFGRKNKKYFLFAVAFGMLPDALVFGWQFTKHIIQLILGNSSFVHIMPFYIVNLYNITHSLVIAGIVCAIVFALLRKKALPLLGWPLHIIFDIPSHSFSFFPTPFLWPFATPFFDGIPWVTPWVFYLNWGTLIVLMASWYLLRKK